MIMNASRFPFWAVTERKSPGSLLIGPVDRPRNARAFSTFDMLTIFLDASIGVSWNVSLASDGPELVLFVADLHRDGAIGVCIDSEPDGSEGTDIPLAELLDHGYAKTAE
jgi:hypothetical protein